jgi:Xaa-Pro aminopeptidase
MTIAARLDRLCAADGSEFFLVTRREDIRWLTGFTGSTSQLLVKRANGESFLYVDGRYIERAQAELARAGSSTTLVAHTHESPLVDHVRSLGVIRLAVDFHHITAARLTDLRESFEVVNESGRLDELRRVKDDGEIALMQRAAKIADKALVRVVSEGLLGESEKQIRNRLDSAMREYGADDVSFETIVATGPNGARPHHEPTDDVVELGHGVVIDMGAEVNGYRSDMTRTVRVGQWSTEYQQMFDIVREAQAAGVATVGDGVVGSDVDAAVCAVFDREGVRDEYLHGTGHGVGLYIHEEPILSPRCTAILRRGEVVTVEPGLYRKGVGGVRIEDQVVVTGTGCRTLTLSPKELSCPRSPRTT